MAKKAKLDVSDVAVGSIKKKRSVKLKYVIFALLAIAAAVGAFFVIRHFTTDKYPVYEVESGTSVFNEEETKQSIEDQVHDNRKFMPENPQDTDDNEDNVQ